jgi:uncharacterized protein YecT (DUF1311 family)
MSSVLAIVFALSVAQPASAPVMEPSVQCATHLTNARARQSCLDDLLETELADLELAFSAAQSEADEIDLDTGGRMGVRDSFERAQSAWVSYRDLECQRRSSLMILDEAGQSEIVTACQIRLTRVRAAELREN